MSHDPWLLTPGPLTTSLSVKQAMLHDWGSRDGNFVAINNRIRERLVAMIGGQGAFTCVPMQGAGTFAVEAMLTSFVPRDGKVAILVNGAYGQRARKICQVAGRAHVALETAEDTPPDLTALEALLARDTAITHVFAVHCETTSGILNPIAEIVELSLAPTEWPATTILPSARTNAPMPRSNWLKPGSGETSVARSVWTSPAAKSAS